jgi:hypothetical protein
MPRIYSFNNFLKHIYGRNESVFTCVLGKNETGKTDFNLLQMERLHDLGIVEHFGTNMESVKADFEIKFIDNFKTLENTCRMLNPDPKKQGLKKFYYFMSEIGKSMPRDEAWKNTQFIGKLQTVRKYGLSMLTDAIDRVDARILSPRFFAGEFEKPFQNNKKFATFEEYATGRKFQFKDIPKTRIEYDTYETASFYMEPQGQEGAIVPLNYEHEIAFKYLELGSWKKLGISTQEGKRCLLKVLRFHKAHCLPSLDKIDEELAEIKVEIDKDSVKVTE